MPSLPTKNCAPECPFDLYRRYLPPSYCNTFDVYMSHSFRTLFFSYLSFLIQCGIYVLLIFGIHWLIIYLCNHTMNQTPLRDDILTTLQDFYWFLLLSLHCYCFTLICYRKLPKEHIHSETMMHCLSKRWRCTLYCTSCIIALFSFLFHISLHWIEWKQYIFHLKIYCNLFECTGWTMSRLSTYVIIPPAAVFLNCLIIDYWLFGCDHNNISSETKSNKLNKNRKINSRTRRNLPCAVSPIILSIVESDDDRDHEHNHYNAHSRISTLDMGPAICGGNSVDGIFNTSLSAQSTVSSNNGEYDSDCLLSPSSYASSLRVPVKSSSKITGATSSSLNVPSTRPSSPRSMLKKSFVAFRYPESKMLKYIGCYCLVFMSVNAIFSALSNVKDHWFHEYFGWIYLFILISTSMLKWILKRIARLIDMSRSSRRSTTNKSSKLSKSRKYKKSGKRSRNKFGSEFGSSISTALSSHLSSDSSSSLESTFISMELCTELYMDFVYYLAYRELMMYYIPEIYEFFKILIYFFAVEIWIYSVRPSRIYYRVTRRIQKSECMLRLIGCVLCIDWNGYHNLNDLNHLHGDDRQSAVESRMLKKRLLVCNWRDDSNELQWQIRCSLDISLRILAGVISSLIIIVEVYVLGPKEFELDLSEWIRGMQYIAMSAGIQLVYFAIVYVWNFQVQQFPLLEPWWSLQISNGSDWKLVTVVLIAIAFWLPDLWEFDG